MSGNTEPVVTIHKDANGGLYGMLCTGLECVRVQLKAKAIDISRAINSFTGAAERKQALRDRYREAVNKGYAINPKNYINITGEMVLTPEELALLETTKGGRHTRHHKSKRSHKKQRKTRRR